ncbi:MAG: SLC13 family permease, partial [Pseudomonadota bacterium]
MDAIALTLEMSVVLGLLVVTVLLFVTEIVRIDVAAVLVMVTLGGLSYLPGLGNLADPSQLFSGFASNAVMSIIAVMIIGAGLDKTGLMSKVAALIIKRGGTTEGRIIPIVSGVVGVISSFMQNVGAAALFLPVMSRISARTEIPMSRLLMPMGFCAILGGTITMVGSSPLILLNDLIEVSNGTLPADQQMEPFGLFSVAPIGIPLVITGILYFVLAGRWVLPKQRDRGTDAGSGKSMQGYIESMYGLRAELFEIRVPDGSIINSQKLSDLMVAHHMYILGTSYRGNKVIAPMADTTIKTPARLAVMGLRRVVEDEFAEPYGLEILPELNVFADDFAATESGVAEVVIPPGSSMIGRAPIETRLRQTHGLSILAIHRGEETMSHVETEDHVATHIGLVPLQAGDTLVAHVQWDRLTRLKSDKDFVIVTSDYPQEELRPNKVGWALTFFVIAVGMILFSDVRLSLCLLTGALGMVLSRVLSIDEAYQAVSWATVFLLASLIPLGQAVQETG